MHSKYLSSNLQFRSLQLEQVNVSSSHFLSVATAFLSPVFALSYTLCIAHGSFLYLASCAAIALGSFLAVLNFVVTLLRFDGPLSLISAGFFSCCARRLRLGASSSGFLRVQSHIKCSAKFVGFQAQID